jgi:hypothetical protein
MTRIAMRPPVTGALLSPGALVDLLWLNATESDGIKHIHARANGGDVEVIMFRIPSEHDNSEYIVRRVCERAVRIVPALKGWQVGQ